MKCNPVSVENIIKVLLDWKSTILLLAEQLF